MSQNELKLPGYYIVQKTDGSGKEQIVKYTQKTTGEGGKPLYWGNYGLYGYHEIASSMENIRELNSEEQRLFKEKKYNLLPQQFYHSHPSC